MYRRFDIHLLNISSWNNIHSVIDISRDKS